LYNKTGWNNQDSQQISHLPLLLLLIRQAVTCDKRIENHKFKGKWVYVEQQAETTTAEADLVGSAW